MNLDELKQKALGSVEGPWTWHHTYRGMHSAMLEAKSGYMFGQIDDPQTGEYIAAASPDVVLKLIDRIEKLEAVAEAAKYYIHKLHTEGCDDLTHVREVYRIKKALAELEKEE